MYNYVLKNVSNLYSYYTVIMILNVKKLTLEIINTVCKSLFKNITINVLNKKNLIYIFGYI